MFIKHLIGAAAALASAAIYAAHPQITAVSVSQKGARITVNYTLTGDSAVVTVDFQTKDANDVWSSIGVENFRNLSGDVNRLVDAGARQLVWNRVYNEWPGHQIADGNFRAVLKAWHKTQPPPYMAFDITGGQVRYYVSTNALPGGFDSDVYKSSKVLMRRIEAAGKTFVMGGPSDYSATSKETRHYVTFTNDFYLGVYEVTQLQFVNMYKLVNSAYTYDGSWANQDGGKAPASSTSNGKVSYWEIRGWDGLSGGNVRWPQTGMEVGSSSVLKKLRDRTTDIIFDLPTEAQWEFACRAGTRLDFNTGTNALERYYGHDNENESGYAKQDLISWNSHNSDKHPHGVGQKLPNNWGLYDMHGNVLEMCRDIFCEDLGSDHQFEPTGVTSEDYSAGPNHNVRGGCYLYNMCNMRSSRRNGANYGDNVGFRLWADGKAGYGK